MLVIVTKLSLSIKPNLGKLLHICGIVRPASTTTNLSLRTWYMHCCAGNYTELIEKSTNKLDIDAIIIFDL